MKPTDSPGGGRSAGPTPTTLATRSTIPLPHFREDADLFADAVKKTIAECVLDPQSRLALLDGLKTPDLRERRQWWTLALEFGIGRPEKTAEAGGTRIQFVNNVPGPAGEFAKTITPKKD